MSKITIYTDGSCWNGQYEDHVRSASSVVIILNADLKFVDYFLSARNHGTSNRAEIDAILDGIQYAIERKYKEIDVYTDSKYSIRIFTKEIWDKNTFSKMKFNMYSKFIKINLIHTQAHSGNTYNEIADEIAGMIRKSADKYLNEHLKLPTFG